MAGEADPGAGMGVMVGATVVIVAILGAVFLIGSGSNLFGGPRNVTVDISASPIPTPSK